MTEPVTDRRFGFGAIGPECSAGTERAGLAPSWRVAKRLRTGLGPAGPGGRWRPRG